MTKRYALWDFDGTLGCRPGNWGSAIQDAAQSYYISKSLDWEQVVPLLSHGLPWHEPTTPHRNLSSPEHWWEHVEQAIALKFAALGYEEPHLRPLAKLTHEIYVNPKCWSAMDDAARVLASVQLAGWTNIVVTNHVPEVGHILESLQLSDYVTKIFCSAKLGVEKPHPDFFPGVLAELEPYRDIWVIGDTVEADIVPARVLGGAVAGVVGI